MIARFIYIFFLAVFFLGSICQAYFGDARSSDNIDFETLRALIEKKKVRSLEAALAALHSENSEFFNHYILMYRSRSLQKASFEAPRAIVFGESAKFILTFNGSSEQRGYDNLELLQFEQKDFSFVFREIHFSPDQPPQFSEPNPKKCLSCHQSGLRRNVDPRPLWEPYEIWPGAYGSLGGKLGGGKGSFSFAGDNRVNPEDQLMVSENSLETKAFEHFQGQVKSNHPRYHFLGRFNAHQTAEFNDIIGHLNFQRVTRLVKSLGKIFDIYNYAFAGAVRCAETFLPKDLQKWHENGVDQKKIPPSFESRHRFNFKNEGDDFARTVSIELQVLFEPLGIPLDDWSMDFKTNGRFAFNERFGVPSTETENFTSAAVKVMGGEVFQKSCQQLKNNSLQSIRQQEWTATSAQLFLDGHQPAQQKNLLTACIGCHSRGERSSAPPIPFNQPEELRLALKRTGYPRGSLLDEIRFRLGSHASFDEQMPPNFIPTEEQKRQLIDFLETTARPFLPGFKSWY